MTIKEVAQILNQQGYSVSFRKRSDGGYIITKIGGVSYKGAAGNITARKMAGVELSHARSYQLERIRPPKEKAPMARKVAKVPEDLVKEMRKVHRLWRKGHADIRGTISMKGLRYHYETYGEEGARASLNKAFRYAQGYAYIENVEWIIERLKSDMDKADDPAVIQSIIDKIKEKMLVFREDWTSKIHEYIYDFERHIIDENELERRIDGTMV